MTWKIAVTVKRFLVIFFKADSLLKKTPFSINAVIFCRTSRDLFGIIAKLRLCKLCIVHKKILLLKYYCFFQTIII